MQIHNRKSCPSVVLVHLLASKVVFYSVVGSGSCNSQRFTHTLESLGFVDCKGRRQYTIPRLLYCLQVSSVGFSSLRSPLLSTRLWSPHFSRHYSDRSNHSIGLGSCSWAHHGNSLRKKRCLVSRRTSGLQRYLYFLFLEARIVRQFAGHFQARLQFETVLLLISLSNGDAYGHS